MDTVTVPVVKAFVFDRQSYSAGDLITVSPIEAAALERQGYVSLARGYRTREMVAAPVVDEIEIPRRRRGGRRSARRSEPTDVQG